MKKVKFARGYQGEDQYYTPGSVVEFEADVAQELVECDFAEYAGDEPLSELAPVVEKPKKKRSKKDED